MLQDEDGLMRHFRVSRTYQDERVFTMPLVLAALKRGHEPEETVAQIAESAAIPDEHMLDGSYLFSFRMPERGFTRIPCCRVLRGQFGKPSRGQLDVGVRNLAASPVLGRGPCGLAQR